MQLQKLYHTWRAQKIWLSQTPTKKDWLQCKAFRYQGMQKYPKCKFFSVCSSSLSVILSSTWNEQWYVMVTSAQRHVKSAYMYTDPQHLAIFWYKGWWWLWELQWGMGVFIRINESLVPFYWSTRKKTGINLAQDTNCNSKIILWLLSM